MAKIKLHWTTRLLDLWARFVYWVWHSHRDERRYARWMVDCPYYRGTGACAGGVGCGTWGEPICRTDEPDEGWRAHALGRWAVWAVRSVRWLRGVASWR